VARDLGLEADVARGLHLQLLTPGLSLSHDVRLRVADVRSGGTPDLWLLRMECGSRSDCMPFEVALRYRPAAPGGPLVRSQQKQPSAATEAHAPLVKPGQKVRLAEEVSGMRLSAPGICLQAGSLGQRIRVRNAASGRVVLARVSGSSNVMVEQ